MKANKKHKSLIGIKQQIPRKSIIHKGTCKLLNLFIWILWIRIW